MRKSAREMHSGDAESTTIPTFTFNTGRTVIGLSPIKDTSTKTLVGGEMYYTDGATLSPQRYVRGTLFAKASETFGNNAELSGWVSGSSGDYSGSGQIPLRAVRNHTLDEYSGFVEDSGEGRWTVNAAIDEAVPAEVLTAALYARFRSRKEHTFAEKILSAMRAGFGGHKEPKNPAPKA